MLNKIWPLFPKRPLSIPSVFACRTVSPKTGVLPVRRINPEEIIEQANLYLEKPEFIISAFARMRMTLWSLTAFFAGCSCVTDGFLIQAVTVFFIGVLLSLWLRKALSSQYIYVRYYRKTILAAENLLEEKSKWVKEGSRGRSCMLTGRPLSGRSS